MKTNNFILHPIYYIFTLQIKYIYSIRKRGSDNPIFMKLFQHFVDCLISRTQDFKYKYLLNRLT